MLQSGSQDERAERREYEFAKTYTEGRQGPLRRRVALGKTLAFLLIALTPASYAAVMPLLSDHFEAGWFHSWAGVTAGIASVLTFMLPGLGAGSRSIYGDDAQALADFLHFASIDTLSVLAVGFLIFGMSTSIRLVPKPGSVQLDCLENIAKGFPIGRGTGAKRVGGTTGGLFFALLQIAIVFGLLYAFVFLPAMTDGAMFRDAHFHCTLSSGGGKSRHCIEYAANSLDQTIWKLGWMFSLAAVLVPLGIWYGLVCLTYPVWLALGPRRN